jgi:hypothetical protein
MRAGIAIAICSITLALQAGAAELEGASWWVSAAHTNAGSRAWLAPAEGYGGGLGSAGATLGTPNGASVGTSHEVAAGFWPAFSTAAWGPEVCPGDVNGDGVVGGLDYVILLGAFSSSAGEAAFVPEADLNGDGVVGGPDVSIFFQGYGCTTP